MHAWHGALWGAVGGAVVEAYDAVAVVRRTGTWPWSDPPGHLAKGGLGVWLFAAVVRIAAGAGTAAAASGQISGELGAFGIGVAGPLALERLVAVVLPRPVSTTPGGAIRTATPEESRTGGAVSGPGAEEDAVDAI